MTGEFDADYNPFSGFTGNGQKSEKREFGSTLKPVDYSSKIVVPRVSVVPNQWVILDHKALEQKAKQQEIASNPVNIALAKPPVQLTSEEAQAWRQEHHVTIFGDKCPTPITDFNSLLAFTPKPLVENLLKQGFASPTAIQSQAWPVIFQGRDFVGIAKTGSGKTLGFMAPAIAHILAQPPLMPRDGPIVLVLAPTRELAQQIEVETKKVLPANLRCACVYGGTSKGPQIAQLSAGVHVLIACPGRLIDLLEIRRLSLTRVTYLVLDEADRMLDMGFEPQIRTICSQVRTDRQTLMFSATWPKEIRDLASSFQKDFLRIHVGSTELSANADVEQHFYFIEFPAKMPQLKELLAKYQRQRILVFVRTKKNADFLEYQLRGLGFNAAAIHGDKEQFQRDTILNRFRRETNLIMVATDVAARGLDVKNLDVVINFDMPLNIEDYVHRIGRTGRAGSKGEAFSFFTQEDGATSGRALIGLLAKSNKPIPARLEEMVRFSRPQPKPGFGKFSRGMPAFRYQHNDRPSFDPASRTHAAPANGNGSAYFGVSNPGAKRTTFHDDDDESAVKKPRYE